MLARLIGQTETGVRTIGGDCGNSAPPGIQVSLRFHSWRNAMKSLLAVSLSALVWLFGCQPGASPTDGLPPTLTPTDGLVDEVALDETVASTVNALKEFIAKEQMPTNLDPYISELSTIKGISNARLLDDGVNIGFLGADGIARIIMFSELFDSDGTTNRSVLSSVPTAKAPTWSRAALYLPVTDSALDVPAITKNLAAMGYASDIFEGSLATVPKIIDILNSNYGVIIISGHGFADGSASGFCRFLRQKSSPSPNPN
jgi:hypothetical protein